MVRVLKSRAVQVAVKAQKLPVVVVVVVVVVAVAVAWRMAMLVAARLWRRVATRARSYDAARNRRKPVSASIKLNVAAANA